VRKKEGVEGRPTNPHTVPIKRAFEALNSYNTEQRGSKENEEHDINEQGGGAFKRVEDSLDQVDKKHSVSGDGKLLRF
jgi:hypothetical protein